MTDQPQRAGVPRSLTVPITMPAEIDGFRFARVADGADADNRPVVSPERGYVTDPAERGRVLDYLRAGAVVMMVGGLGLDVYDPDNGSVVALGSRTDGSWIWPDGLAYYLERHGVAPEPELYQRIREHDYRCPVPGDERVRAASAALRERYRIARELRRSGGPSDGPSSGPSDQG